MSPDRYRAALATSLDRLIPLACQPEKILTRSVPACPGWTLDELFGHLGSIERWAVEVLLEGKPADKPAPPTTGAAAWFIDGTNTFLGTMTALTPEAQCWNFGPPPRTAGFWLRRQAHEHAIHLVDACQASDLEAPILDEDFMLDGIDEVLSMFTPRQLRQERMPRPEAAVTFRVPGATTWKIGQGPSQSSINAPLQEMYLGLWGRSNLADTAIIEGDVAFALRVLQGPLTP
ncbi:maleylpyruvate isomerase family mycothiol-dependent enzyme [Arthrobacter sulfonylureivorans]|uniref:Maleylpyruvate isomerase family mycothiol-dependent enzyme n=1 Tax=Arthrobacter sulfonylureivorans TaxID=2486855 RepID=A0ABY3WEZ2_9MICC|nr:maleylpyruvate isomerase family mycothiol-dependent enzyme [Arthrobacter sulfonylureivorans]UNK47795.1 maleylpyruvate isomerase family mycothiol-dependent enzyme [Arthrobacter sulfonylureivorans]